MTWELTLEAVPSPVPSDVADAADALLLELERTPNVRGVVTFANAATGTVGARFDVEAPVFEDAIIVGLRAFVDASRTSGMATVSIQRAEAEVVRDDERVAVDR